MIKLNLAPLVKLERKIRMTPKELEALREETLDRYGERLLDETIRRASGRPGPNIVTSAYVSNFALVKDPDGMRRVVNHSPQAHRLEYGFVGTDSLGRNYNQPPYPHFRPALMFVGEMFKEEMRRLPKKAWRAA